MKLTNSYLSFPILNLILVCFATLSPSIFKAQFVDNSKAQIILDEFYFNSNSIKRKRIKTIAITFFEKKELKGINQTKGKIKHYLFDEEGKINRHYYTYNYYHSKPDTMVEWHYYKNNQLTTVKSGSNKNIKVKSIFYEDNKPSIFIIGKSYNISNSLTTIKVNSYQEKSAEYINYTTTPNGDQITEFSFTDKTVYKKIVSSKTDSGNLKEIISYPAKNQESTTYEFSYTNNFLTKLSEINSHYPDYYYHFYYDSNGRLVGYSKYSYKWQSKVEVAELLYNEGTGNLQAILIKDNINNSIKIRKFTYTYF